MRELAKRERFILPGCAQLEGKTACRQELRSKRNQRWFAEVYGDHDNLLSTATRSGTGRSDADELEARTEARALHTSSDQVGAENIMDHLIARNVLTLTILPRPTRNHIPAR